MKIKLLPDRVDLYIANKAINQSSLKLCYNNPMEYYHRYVLGYNDERKEKLYLLKGSLIDTMLTEPEEFDKRYVIRDLKRVSGKTGDFIRMIAKGMDEEEAYKLCDFSASYSLERVRESVFNNPVRLEYFNALKDNTDRAVVTQEEYDEAKCAADEVYKDSIVGRHLKHMDMHNDRYTQFPIYFEMEIGLRKVACKGMLDLVYFNHDHKEITPIDIKTTSSSPGDFADTILKWRYDIQAAFYSYGLSKLYPDYTITPFQFIIIDPKCAWSPHLYIMDSDDIELATYGDVSGQAIVAKELRRAGDAMPSLMDMMDRFLEYQDSNQYTRVSIPSRLYERQKEINL